ncbi:MAG TPA: hypothetical protein VFL91_21645 [Thermomicrobiales bacterium]|nr:hypothetical protein [Thermomicrobiales bacterium]
MPDRAVRIYGAAPPLTARERREVAGEVAGLRALVAALPGEPLVEVRRNPAGLLGEYVALLLDATARGVPARALWPPTVRLRYGRRRWFAFSLAALAQGRGDLPARDTARVAAQRGG